MIGLALQSASKHQFIIDRIGGFSLMLPPFILSRDKTRTRCRNSKIENFCSAIREGEHHRIIIPISCLYRLPRIGNKNYFEDGIRRVAHGKRGAGHYDKEKQKKGAEFEKLPHTIV